MKAGDRFAPSATSSTSTVTTSGADTPAPSVAVTSSRYCGVVSKSRPPATVRRPPASMAKSPNPLPLTISNPVTGPSGSEASTVPTSDPTAASSRIENTWPAATTGGSLTSAIVMTKPTGSPASSPPPAVPPSSTRRTSIRAVPWAPGAGVKASTPEGLRLGGCGEEAGGRVGQDFERHHLAGLVGRAGSDGRRPQSGVGPGILIDGHVGAGGERRRVVDRGHRHPHRRRGETALAVGGGIGEGVIAVEVGRRPVGEGAVAIVGNGASGSRGRPGRGHGEGVAVGIGVVAQPLGGGEHPGAVLAQGEGAIVCGKGRPVRGDRVALPKAGESVGHGSESMVVGAPAHSGRAPASPEVVVSQQAEVLPSTPFGVRAME